MEKKCPEGCAAPCCGPTHGKLATAQACVGFLPILACQGGRSSMRLREHTLQTSSSPASVWPGRGGVTTMVERAACAYGEKLGSDAVKLQPLYQSISAPFFPCRIKHTDSQPLGRGSYWVLSPGTFMTFNSIRGQRTKGRVLSLSLYDSGCM